jgi:FSR family fosmidomycin resistance protein-like MFS transporter
MGICKVAVRRSFRVSVADPTPWVALNGTSSVLYGSVPDLDAPERRARAFSIFYTGAIGAGAPAPILYRVVGDALGMIPAVLIIGGLVLLTLPYHSSRSYRQAHAS